MKKLSAANFAKARTYLLSEARPLDQALFEYHFENGPATAVWRELSAFQNDDGGFGRALEPDLRTPTSSALATGIALRTLAGTGATVDHPLVRDAAAYLQKTLDKPTLTWRVAPLDSNDYAHAPWWHDQDGSLSATFDAYQIIPRAELVAYLQHFANPAPEPWLSDVTEAAVLAIENLPLGGGGGDDLVYAIRLVEAKGLPEADRQRLLRRIRETVPAAVTRDPAQWETYSIPPLKLAPTPDSVVADLFPEDLQRNLNFVIEKQTDAGYWELTWTWGDFYADDWPAAREEWRGELTLHNLLSLQAYGRII